MKQLKLVVATVVAVLIIVILLQNTKAVETRLLFVTVSMPRAVLLIVTLLIGFALGVLTGGRLIGARDKKKG